jgi:hypothetical protein
MIAIRTAVKLCVYVCLSSVFFLSLNFTLVLFDLQNWEPLAGSVSHMVFALWSKQRVRVVYSGFDQLAV